MSLLTPQLRKALPALEKTSETPLGDLMVHARFFDPSSGWSWYPMEFDGSDVFFGVVASARLAFAGQFTLRELEALAGESAEASGVRRDDCFKPVRLAELARQDPKIAQVFAESGMKLVKLQNLE